MKLLRAATALAAMVGATILLPSVEEARASGPVLGVDSLALTYKQFLPGGNDPLITGPHLQNRTLDKEVALELNTTVFDYGYMNHWIHSMTDKDVHSGKGQFRTVGWRFELGVRLSESTADIFYSHHSQHTLDVTSAFGFPVQDAIGIRLYLLPPKRRTGVLP